MLPRKRESVFDKEVIFHLYNTISISLLIHNYFFEYIAIDSPFLTCHCEGVFRLWKSIHRLLRFTRNDWLRNKLPIHHSSLKFPQFTHFHRLHSLRYIHLNRFITSKISRLRHFFFRKWRIDEISRRIIKIKRTHPPRKKFPQLRTFTITAPLLSKGGDRGDNLI